MLETAQAGPLSGLGSKRQEAVVSRIFINYRRDDTSNSASMLYDWLSERYGEDHVFMDVEGSIAPGHDWAETIDHAVASSDLFLAVIGDTWLAELKRRIDDEHDFMRHELETALSRNMRLIPVLVEGARLPQEDELPPSLVALRKREVYEIKTQRWRYERQAFLSAVDRALGVKHPVLATAGRRPSWMIAAVGGVAFVAALAVLLVVVISRNGSDTGGATAEERSYVGSVDGLLRNSADDRSDLGALIGGVQGNSVSRSDARDEIGRIIDQRSKLRSAVAGLAAPAAFASLAELLRRSITASLEDDVAIRKWINARFDGGDVSGTWSAHLAASTRASNLKAEFLTGYNTQAGSLRLTELPADLRY